MVKQGDAQGSNYNGPGETPGAWAKAVEMEAEHRKPRPHQPRNVGLVRNYLHKGFSMSSPPRTTYSTRGREFHFKTFETICSCVGAHRGALPPPILPWERCARQPPLPQQSERVGCLLTPSHCPLERLDFASPGTKALIFLETRPKISKKAEVNCLSYNQREN